MGAGIGTEEYRRHFLKDKVEKFSKELKLLSSWTITDPHECFCCFTKSLMAKWRYLMRTMGCFSDVFSPLDEIIEKSFFPSLFGRDIDPVERTLFSLPCRLGGLGIPVIRELAKNEYEASQRITFALKSRILNQTLV